MEKPVQFKNRHFITVPFQDGVISDVSQSQHPTMVLGWGHEGKSLELSSKATHFCFVVKGEAKITIPRLENKPLRFNVCAGMYFAINGIGTIEGGTGIVISRLGCNGLFQIGGPIEELGRFRYIDGCSDSLLIPPVMKGYPCLNHLHFPKGISQTRHTHPSIRVGIVARGKGNCVIPTNEDGSGPDISLPLVPGQVFIIPENGQHCFFTAESTMDIIAYHPDSDTGPDDDNHPMINRTIVNGMSASKLTDIRTINI